MPSPRRVLLGIFILFLLLLLLTLLLRPRLGDRLPSPATAGPAASSVMPVVSAPIEPPTVEDSGPPKPAMPAPISSPAGSALFSIHVTDVYGIEIKEPGLNILITGSLSFDGDENQLKKFRIYGADAGIRILCGDHDSYHRLVPGENFIQLTHGFEFGELAIKPSEWEKVKVRIKGGSSWKNPTGVDPDIGRRFLFLRPGEYEISDHKGFVVGSAAVVGGRRTTFVLTRLAGIKLDVSFTNESEVKPAPTMLPVEIRGLTPNASFPEGYRILLMARNKQRTYIESGLEPGTYQVTSEALAPRFQETFVIQGGEVRTVKFTHTID